MPKPLLLLLEIILEKQQFIRPSNHDDFLNILRNFIVVKIVSIQKETGFSRTAQDDIIGFFPCF